MDGGGCGGDSRPAQLSLPTTPSVRPKVSRVTINVNGDKITVDPALFHTQPHTMLGRMFGASLDNNLTKKNCRGEYEIGNYVSEHVFRLILDYYRYGSIRIPSNIPVADVKHACDYLMVPFNGDTVRADNVAQLMHELANDGAQTQFQQFFDSVIFREMIALAHKGERECHILVLMEDDAVDWDPEYPPPKTDSADDEAQLVRDDRLCRFLKYLENREQAKLVLKERGLKKIRLGIEGFPTQMEKLKTSTRGGGKPEVVYNYIQRPFIHMSWEKEEARSRHVDFQCPPPVNLSTNLAEAASDTDIDHTNMLISDMDMPPQGSPPAPAAADPDSEDRPLYLPHPTANTATALQNEPVDE